VELLERGFDPTDGVSLAGFLAEQDPADWQRWEWRDAPAPAHAPFDDAAGTRPPRNAGPTGTSASDQEVGAASAAASPSPQKSCSIR
jgi:hypothetical protein